MAVDTQSQAPVQEQQRDTVYFARCNFRGSNKLLGVRRADRRQHMYVVGKTGTGKTVFLHNLVIQDIYNGDGVAVVDPHGEFADEILEKIPPERMNDVIYFNPADPDYHIGFNVLELLDPKYKHLTASGLMGIFTKMWANVWSARMEYIMNNCILALLDTPGSTMMGIARLLTDKDYRQKIVANLQDPVVKAFWIHEYEAWNERFRTEAIAAIQNKVGQFLSTSLIRNIVGQKKSTIDIFDIMNKGKIFIVNVSKGRIGEDNSALLGSMLITKIQLAAMERVRIPEDERKDFFLYVDEFQNFATDSFAGILSEARKYRLNIIISHQYTGQLVTDTSTKVRDAVFGNVGTLVVFRVGAPDAEFLESEFEPEFEPQDLVNLPNYNVILRPMYHGVSSRPFSAVTLPPFKIPTSASTKQQIIEQSRKLYGRHREIVEEELKDWSVGSGPEDSGAQTAGGEKYQTECWNCGTSTTVPFQPETGRPVYCKNCLSKIKSGEMPKPQFKRPPRVQEVMRPVQQDKSVLSSLGIEFSQKQPVAEKRSAPPSDFKEKPKMPPSFSSTQPREAELVVSKPNPSTPTISLSSLKEKTRPVKRKSAQNIDALRAALKETLREAQSESEQEKSENS